MNAKIITQIMVIVAIIALIVTGMGCMDSKPMGEEIKNKVLETYSEVDAYKVSMSMNMTMRGGGVVMPINMNVGELVDNKNQRMQMDMKMTMPAIMNMGIYLIEDEMYRKVPAEWIKKELNETEKEYIWNKHDYLKKEVEMINNSKVEVLGDEKIRGVDSWVVEIIPDEEALKEYVIAELMRSSVGDFSKSEEMVEMEFKNITIKYWVSKRNYFITKVGVWSDFVMTYIYMNVNTSMNMNISAEIYDYNKSLNIVLPEDALNAKTAEEMMAEEEFDDGFSEEPKFIVTGEPSEEDLEKLLAELNTSQKDLEKLLEELNES